jgi:hypothetical protein
MTRRLHVARIAAHLYNALVECVSMMPSGRVRTSAATVLTRVGIRLAHESLDAAREQTMRAAARSDSTLN